MRVSHLRHIWLLAVVMALAVACQGSEEGTQPTPEDTQVVEDDTQAGDGGSGTQLAPIQILINDSPWFPGFGSVVDRYVEETGNQVTLDVTPNSGMLQKARTATQASESSYDIVNLDTQWTVEFYEGDLLTPLTEIDPGFELPEEVLTYGDSYFWNADKGWRTSDEGMLMTIPANINIHLLFYRGDLYEEAELAPPETWDDALATCEAMQDQPDLYGYVVRGERGNPIRFNWMPFMLGHGAAVVADPENGDFTVTINSPEAKAALDQYIQIAESCSPENVAAMGQNEMIELLASGRALQAHVVTAAWAQMDDPDSSIVVGEIDTVPVPRPVDGEQVSVIGNWHLGIPHNLPDERKQAALAFLEWFVGLDVQMEYAEAGSLPVRSDVFASELADREEFRYFSAYLEAIPNSVQVLGYREGPQVLEVLGLRLNEALIGELSTAEALNQAAQDIFEIFEASGRDTGMLDPLAEG